MHRPLARRRLLTGLVLLGTAGAALLLPTTPAASTVVTGCPAGGVKVSPSNSPRLIAVTDTTTNRRLRVRVTLTGPSFTIEPTRADDVLDDASWCLKAGKRFETGTGTEGTTSLTNKFGVPLPIRFLVVYSVTTFTDPAGTCFPNDLFSPDVLYLGPINTVNNAAMPCDAPAPNLTVVQGSDLDTLNALCVSLGYAEVFASLRDIGLFTAPEDFYYCGPL